MTMETTPWCSLDYIFSASRSDVDETIEGLSPGWRIFLQGDGSPTRILRILTGKPTEVDVIDYTVLETDEIDGAPAEVREVPNPHGRRQVWLRNSEGERLGYACSWWDTTKMDKFMKTSDTPVPIGSNLTIRKAELYRDIRRVFLGNSKQLEEAFGHPGPFWGRTYIFWHGGHPLTLIYEVFSPTLCKYLGNPVEDESLLSCKSQEKAE